MKPHAINLIDTPGHADFTFEVLRSLRVLDGAICILDSVAGVEAQTEKVWYQANTYHIPRIIYVNKLDRDGASFGRTVKEIGARLTAWPAVCQIPWWDRDHSFFVGLGDVIRLRGLRWEGGGDGKVIRAFEISELEQDDMTLAGELKKARIALVELLSEHDDRLVEKFLEHDGNHVAIPAADIVNSLRRCLLKGSGKIVPVFAGSSLKNIGVQPLLDAAVELLPDPTERPDADIVVGSTTARLNEFLNAASPAQKSTKRKNPTTTNESGPGVLAGPTSLVANLEACALAFKVVSDARRGVLVYVRIYSGTLHRNAVIFNTNLQVSERAQRLLKMYAADAVEILSIATGQIGVIAGLEYARTGDTLISYTGMSPKRGPPAPLNTLQLRPISIPPPVFFASIEPRSLSEERQLRDSLALLLREDPSLSVSVDEGSGQTLLSGMGELHLEIARDRLVKDFKSKAEMGGIEIGYHECLIDASSSIRRLYDRDIAGRKGKAGCEAKVQPLLDFDAVKVAQSNESNESNGASHTAYKNGNLINITIQGMDVSGRSSDPAQLTLPFHLSFSIIHTSLTNGALGALVRGPIHSYPMQNTHVIITLNLSSDIFGAETTSAALTSAARQATSAALKDAAAAAAVVRGGRGTILMEPVMNVSISVDEASLGAVMHDLSAARGGHVLSLDNISPSAASAAAAAAAAPSRTASVTQKDDEIEDTTLAIDTRKIYTPPDPFEGNNNNITEASAAQQLGSRPRTITARVPLKEMVGYLKHLRSLTGGRGTFVMTVDRFEKMSAQREKAVLDARRGLF